MVQAQPGGGRCQAAPAKLGGASLIGRKPVRFCAWLFRALGAQPGDELADLYPGTGMVGAAFRAWCEGGVSRGSGGDVSPLQRGDGNQVGY